MSSDPGEDTQSEAKGPKPSGAKSSTTPLGLDLLANIDGLFVRQKVDPGAVATGWESQNEYKFFDRQNQQIFYAKEDTDWAVRRCYRQCRPFDIRVYNMNDQEVIRLLHPTACGVRCIPCFLQSVEVYTAKEELLGTVNQECLSLVPKFTLRDAQGKKVLTIKGPFFTCSCCANVEFQLMALDGETKLGKISRNWSDVAREAFHADHFGAEFPKDTDTKVKAALLGACMLIDFMFFQEPKKK